MLERKACQHPAITGLQCSLLSERVCVHAHGGAAFHTGCRKGSCDNPTFPPAVHLNQITITHIL